MKPILYVFATVCFALPAFAATPRDACSLLNSTDIERVQNARLITAKSTEHDDGRLTSRSCYFKMAPESSSVSLQILVRAKGDSVDLEKFWESRFGKDADDKEETEEAKEHRNPPEPVAGIGKEAYWVDTGRDGALYVLNDAEIIRLSLGGRSARADKRLKCVELLKHLQQRSGPER
jgi:hypothetical protein